MKLKFGLDEAVDDNEVLELYKANKWSSAEKPAQLLAALRNSHSLVTARAGDKLVGLGNAISDGHLVVYYPHMLVHPNFQRRGVGKGMMLTMQSRYAGFHQQMLTADGDAVEFYCSLGFVRAGKTQSMWIYAGSEH
jgi:GNAT superfamily N-acetyltransferase